MRYISHYEEYPIYEPAEGGYYYSGNQIVASERKSKRACKKNLLEIWEECKQDNAERGFREDNICFDFGKYSPAGQDFHVSAELEDMEIDTLMDNLNSRYADFDCSEETYLWLDSTGHGTNGAPYDMKDLYEDMEACQEMIMELYRAFESAE